MQFVEWFPKIIGALHRFVPGESFQGFLDSLRWDPLKILLVGYIADGRDSSSFSLHASFGAPSGGIFRKLSRCSDVPPKSLKRSAVVRVAHVDGSVTEAFSFCQLEGGGVSGGCWFIIG